MQVFSSECKQLKGELPNSLHRDLCNTATHTPEKCRFVKGIQEKTRKTQANNGVYEETACQDSHS